MKETDRNIFIKGYQEGKEVGKKIAINKDNTYLTGVLDERHRTKYALLAQIDLITDRINYTNSEQLRKAWAIAAIEIQEIIEILEKPVRELRYANKKV
jgi:hypothetical protein